jgi:DNA recombination protein RmuC
MHLDLTMLAALVTLGVAVASIVIVTRQARALQSLRLLAEQGLAGTRAEAETTRKSHDAAHLDTVERIARLDAARQTGLAEIKTTLAEAQTKAEAAAAERMAQLQAGNDVKLAEIRTTLDLRMNEMREASDAKLAEIRKTVDEQLHVAIEKQMTASFNRVIEQFAEVQKAMGDVRTVTAQIGDIRRLFSNVRARGSWGEAQARAMLEDLLPPGKFETNRKINPDSDEFVEFAVIMPMRGPTPPLLPIDAKFPTEDYERLLVAAEAGDAEAERTARSALTRRVRTEAKKIRDKYIHPPVTVEFAVLYLPSDALYAEIAREPGLIDEIGREQRVLLMGPSLFPALLHTIQLGFVTLTLERKANEVWDLLSATKREMLNMDGVLDRLSRQAVTFTRTIDSARVRTRAVGRTLRTVEAADPAAADALLALKPEADDEEAEPQP